jgi:hypothetical protein
MSSEAIFNRFSHRFVVPDLETTMSEFTATQDIEWRRPVDAPLQPLPAVADDPFC